jgi:adenosylcobinamide-GDP ribazoletransferase
MGVGSLIVAGLFGLAPLLLLPWQAAGAGLLLALLTTFLAARYFVKRIGGYTGDCLGAVQQGAELAIYLGVLAVAWNFS